MAERELNEALNRIGLYLNNGSTTILLPIAEAMLTYKEKSSDDESSQIFVPFVNDVRLGSSDGSSAASVDLDETPTLGSSPPKITPPSSPNVNSVSLSTQTRFVYRIFEISSKELIPEKRKRFFRKRNSSKYLELKLVFGIDKKYNDNKIV